MRRGIRAPLAPVLLLAIAGVANAQSRDEARAQVESTMLLRGEVRIAADGAVEGFSIDREDMVPTEVMSVVRDGFRSLRFEPPGVAARTDMAVRMLSRTGQDGSRAIRIGAARFGSPPKADGSSVTSIDRPAPAYPWGVSRAGATGVVFALLKVGRDGSVEEALVEQVNLGAIGSGGEMKAVRRAFSENTLGALRKWTFRPPTTGETAGATHWSVRVPVAYCLPERTTVCHPPYGQWVGYHPGPRAKLPGWAGDAARDAPPDLLSLGDLSEVVPGYRPVAPIGD